MQIDNDIDEIEINNEQNEMLDQIARRNKTAVIGESLMIEWLMRDIFVGKEECYWKKEIKLYLEYGNKFLVPRDLFDFC